MSKIFGREIIEQKEFYVPGTFESMYAAQKYVHDLGYNYGSTCAMKPLAFVKGEYNLPQKWKNMSKDERNSVDGIIIGDMREGPVTVYFLKPKE